MELVPCTPTQLRIGDHVFGRGRLVTLIPHRARKQVTYTLEFRSLIDPNVSSSVGNVGPEDEFMAMREPEPAPKRAKRTPIGLRTVTGVRPSGDPVTHKGLSLREARRVREGMRKRGITDITITPPDPQDGKKGRSI